MSGDTSCADHNIAWRTRNTLNLDYVPAGVSGDAAAPGQHRLRHHAAARPDAGRQRQRLGPPGVLDAAKTIAAGPPGHALGGTAIGQERAKGRGEGRGLLPFALCPLRFAILTRGGCRARDVVPVRCPSCARQPGVRANPSPWRSAASEPRRDHRIRLPERAARAPLPGSVEPKVTVNMTYLVGSRTRATARPAWRTCSSTCNFIQTHARPRHQEGTDRPRRAVERQHVLRPHQLLRNHHRHRREPALGARARGRAHGEHADGEGAARHGNDRGPQRVRAWREQRPARARGARRSRRRTSGTTTASPRSAPAPTSSACRSTGWRRSIASTISPTTPCSSIAGQFDASKALAHGGRHGRRDPAAGAQAGRDIHRRAGAGRRALRGAAARGRRPGR